jgi:hypothetical protein
MRRRKGFDMTRNKQPVVNLCGRPNDGIGQFDGLAFAQGYRLPGHGSI